MSRAPHSSWVECWSRGAGFPPLTLEEKQSPRDRQENSTWIGLPTQFLLPSSSGVRMEKNWQNSSHYRPVPTDKEKTVSTSSVQFSSVAQSCPTLCDPMNCSTPGLPVYHQLLEFTQTHVHQASDAIQPSHPLSSPSPLSPIPPSIRVFSNESTLCMRWPKYWSFSFAIIPSKEHAGLISFRMHWLDLLTIQGTLESLL